MDTQRDNNFYFARQPILNRENGIVAYELLFRKNTINSLTDYPTNATSQVLVTALNRMGLQDIIGDATKAYINISDETLFDENITTIPTKSFVLEILEDISITPRVVDRVAYLNQKGYTIALDDIICSDAVIQKIKPLLPYVSIIKLETPQDHKQLEKYIPLLKKLKLQILAEKVETQEQYTYYKDLGCDLFQGYFFARPTMISGAKIDPKLVNIFRVISEVSSQNNVKDAAYLFETDAALTFQLLRYINSANFSFRSTIKTITQALQLLGPSNLIQWLTLMTYVIESGDGVDSPLLKLANERATIMSSLSGLLKEDVSKDTAAFIGLLSLVDALCKKPMPELLKHLHIDTTLQHVLLKKEGSLGALLELVLAVEQQEHKMIDTLLVQLNIPFHDFAYQLSHSYQQRPKH
ncbi:MAG TPA: EAL domain-containing protein [Helicobacteraceae bacterium]|nr:EAL domain-containing protein [Helicobacteraceae bacterium]